MKVLAAWMLMCSVCFSQGTVVKAQAVAAAILALQADQPVLPDDYGAPQWSYSGIADEPEPVSSPLPQLYLISEPWCGLCPGAARELDKAGLSYKKVSIAEAKRLRLPFAQVRRGGRWQITENVPQVTYPGAQTAVLGLSTASNYRGYAAKRSAPVSTTVRLSRDEIDAWVRSNYTRSTPLNATVSPISSVWTHLTDGNPNHTFTRDQVQGLEQWVALALHAEMHRANPRIRPTRTMAAAVKPSGPKVATADVTGDDVSLILASLSSALEQPSEAVSGAVNAIPFDVDDSILNLLSALQSDAGKPAGNLKVWFGDTEQRVDFSPALKVKFNRIVEVNAEVRWIKVRGRKATFGLSGTLLDELTVRLK